MGTTTDPAAVTAATEPTRRALSAAWHGDCHACRPAAEGGLGLAFAVAESGAVRAVWTCPPGGGSYPGIVHGGLLATALDSAMVQALFARGVVARTGELTVRYRSEARLDRPLLVEARLQEAHPPLYRLSAEIRQDGRLVAQARAKFMDPAPLS